MDIETNKLPHQAIRGEKKCNPGFMPQYSKDEKYVSNYTLYLNYVDHTFYKQMEQVMSQHFTFKLIFFVWVALVNVHCKDKATSSKINYTII